jgi:hypothetical protein
MADTNLDITVTSKGIKEAQASLKKLEAEAAKAEKASQKLADAAKSLEDKFKLEAASVGKTADQIKILKLEQAGATKAQIEAAKSALSYKEKTLQAAKAADQAAKEQKQLAEALVKSQAAAEKLKQTKLKESLLAEAKAADKLEKEHLQLAKSANQAAAASENLATKQQGTHKAAKELRGGFRAMRGATQQVSYQLQDIAVQAQSGTAGLTILAQQGPQLLSIFGPAGAVAGAFIAFGALIAGVLLPSLMKSEEEVDDLGEALDRLKTISDRTRSGIFALSEDFAKLAKESKGLAELEIELNISKTERGIEQAIKEIEEALNFPLEIRSSLFQAYQDKINGVAKSVNDLNTVSLAGSKKIRAFGESIGLTAREASDLGLVFGKFKEQRTPELFDELQGTIKSLRKESTNLKAFDEFADVFVTQAKNLRLGTQALEDYKKLQSSIKTGPIKSVSDIEGIETERAAFDQMIAEQIALRQTADEKFFASQDARENKVREAAMRGVIDTQKADEALQVIEQASLQRFQESTDKRAKLAMQQGEAAFKEFQKQSEKQQKEEEKAFEQRIAANALINSVLNQQDDKRLSQFEQYQQKTSAKLAEYLNADMISIEAYYAALAVLETQYGDLVNTVRDENEKAQLARNASALQSEADRIYSQMTLMEKWYVATEQALNNVEMLQYQLALSFEQNLGGAIEGLLTGTMSLKEAFKSFVADMLKNFLSMVAQMAAKQIAFSVFGAGVEQAGRASLAAYQGALGQAKVAEAALNAYVATAAIPIVGPAAAPAAAATAAGVAQGLAAANTALNIAAAAIPAGPRALGGQVRGGQSYLVGERGPELLTMGGSGRISSNDQLKNAVGGGGGITIVNNVDARGADASVDVKIRKAMQETAATTIETIRDLSRRRRFI